MSSHNHALEEDVNCMKLMQSSYNLCFHFESLYVFKIMIKENTTFSSNLTFFGTFRLEVELTDTSWNFCLPRQFLTPLWSTLNFNIFLKEPRDLERSINVWNSKLTQSKNLINTGIPTKLTLVCPSNLA